MTNGQKGFSLIELVAVLVLIGIISAAATTYLLPSTTFQLQAARDTVIAALFHAQQRALVQTDSVRLTLTSSTVDIRQDANNNAVYEANESVRVGGIQYPIILDGNVSLSSHTIAYDRMGETSAATITVNKSSSSVDVTLTASGFAY